jgi:hypothetical protein
MEATIKEWQQEKTASATHIGLQVLFVGCGYCNGKRSTWAYVDKEIGVVVHT